jgi:hypothetical protein
MSADFDDYGDLGPLDTVAVYLDDVDRSSDLENYRDLDDMDAVKMLPSTFAMLNDLPTITSPGLRWGKFNPETTSISKNGLTATKDKGNETTKIPYDLVTTGQEMNFGKHYWEVEIMSNVMSRFHIGVTRTNLNPNGWHGQSDRNDAWLMYTPFGSLCGSGKSAHSRGDKKGDNSRQFCGAGAYKQGDRVGVLVNLDDGSLLFFKNGVQHGPGYPKGSLTGPVTHAMQMGWKGNCGRIVANAKEPLHHAQPDKPGAGKVQAKPAKKGCCVVS